ncbi:MAG: radical SAM protein [Dehalococcoidia bacterium]|nr:radical SAM protein [Dehalococcoidia bacterium]
MTRHERWASATPESEAQLLRASIWTGVTTDTVFIMWQSKLTDYLSRQLAYESRIRVHAKRIVEDTRSLVRTLLPWRHLEDVCPPTLSIETTNICNADCVFCGCQFQEDFRNGGGVMTEGIFERALKQYREMGGRNIRLTPLVGEPLVDPNIVRRVQSARDKGFNVSFFTNGLLFGRMDIDAFLKTGIDHIVLSAAPFEKSCFELLFRTEGYHELIAGLKKLLTIRNELDAPLRITILFRSHIPYKDLVALPDYRTEILPLLTEEERKAVYVRTKTFDTWGGQIRKKDLVGIMDLALAPLIRWKPCCWTFSPMVLWDGRVRACASRFAATKGKDGDDGLLMGNLAESRLEDIWHGAEFKDLRRRFLAGDLPLVCRKCTMYRSC